MVLILGKTRGSLLLSQICKCQVRGSPTLSFILGYLSRQFRLWLGLSPLFCPKGDGTRLRPLGKLPWGSCHYGQLIQDLKMSYKPQSRYIFKYHFRKVNNRFCTGYKDGSLDRSWIVEERKFTDESTVHRLIYERSSTETKNVIGSSPFYELNLNFFTFESHCVSTQTLECQKFDTEQGFRWRRTSPSGKVERCTLVCENDL